ncbi:MAG TPA: MaoC family dehydratase, partial [Steroidobacteraceae bacterium]|nr:MaoC family dehydratase [Steroidobacteraceae bacterium]
ARITPKSVVNYGVDKVRFVAPVRSGKRVRNHIHIASVEDKGGGRYLVTTENTIEIEGEIKPALTASSLAMFIA